MQSILIVVLLLSLVGAGISLLLAKVAAYRKFAGLALASLLLYVWSGYGVVGVAVVAVSLAIILPCAITLMARGVVLLAWRDTRRHFQAEPVVPPMPQLTLVGAYRLMWPVN